MNTNPPLKHSSSSSSTTAPSGISALVGGSQRKERGAIAAQACDTCRGRKQKCDEQRPKCGTCQKFELECNYREPQPTKKDKTLVEILERIKSLEGKIDNLSLQGNISSTTTSILSPTPTASTVSNAAAVLTADALASLPLAALTAAETPVLTAAANVSNASVSPYRYVSSVHQMLGWPAMQQHLEPLRQETIAWNPASIEQDGPAIILGLHGDDDRLPAAPAGPLTSVDYLAPQPVNMPEAGPVGPLPPNNTTTLTWDSMQRLSKAYLDTFNFIYPILDRQTFVSGIMASVFNNGFSDDINSTLAFLVFALGEAAIAGVQGLPLSSRNGRPSGIRGGTVDVPPGLALYNEARKRMGFNLTECSLENVQVFALAGLYCGTCSRHMEFWRMSTTASLACQALITSKPLELASPRADTIRRAFWYCSMIETSFNLELGLPLTGLEKLEELTGLPDFSGPYSQDDYLGNQASHFQEHFASQIVLRRLSVQSHNVLSHDPELLASSFPDPSADSHSTSLPSRMRHLALQLDQWRAMLPGHLRWPEDQPAQLPNPTQDAVYDQAAMFPPTAVPVPSVNSPSGFMFTSDLDSIPVSYPYALDVQVAQLRTRYYYSKYLIYRPFVYKALHHPEQMTHDDAEAAAECLKVCLKWPVAMSPTAAHKRLIPCLVFWTQNILGVLVLLHLSLQVPMLSRIRSSLCGARFELEATETVELYIDWLRDLKTCDKAAAWGWDVVKALYRLQD